MKSQFSLTFLLIILYSACNNIPDDNNDVKKDGSITQNKNTSSVDVSGCYMQVRNRDTIVAVLEQNGTEITGKLKFDNYQIDGSSGKLKGIIEGDVLKLKYDFFSEGMHSVMDMYFKFHNDSLFRGLGEMKSNGDSTFFIDTSTIHYTNETVLLKIKCGEVEF